MTVTFNPDNLIFFYIFLAIIALVIVLMALPTMVHGPRKDNKK